VTGRRAGRHDAVVVPTRKTYATYGHAGLEVCFWLFLEGHDLIVVGYVSRHRWGGWLDMRGFCW